MRRFGVLLTTLLAATVAFVGLVSRGGSSPRPPGAGRATAAQEGGERIAAAVRRAPPRFVLHAPAAEPTGEEAPGEALPPAPAELEGTPEAPPPETPPDPERLQEARERQQQTLAEAPRRQAERLAAQLGLSADEQARLADGFSATRAAIEELRRRIREGQLPREAFAFELAAVQEAAKLRLEQIIGAERLAQLRAPARPGGAGQARAGYLARGAAPGLR